MVRGVLKKRLRVRKRKFRRAKTVVIWDVENMKPPRGVDVARIGSLIKRRLRDGGYEGEIRIIAMCANEKSLPAKTIEKLEASPDVEFTVLDEESTADLCDGELKRALNDWKLENPPPANIVVISCDDRAFFVPIVLARAEHYNTALLLNKQTKLVDMAHQAKRACLFTDFLGL